MRGREGPGGEGKGGAGRGGLRQGSQHTTNQQLRDAMQESEILTAGVWFVI